MQSIDSAVLIFFAANRTEWLNIAALVVTYLGSHLLIGGLTFLAALHFYLKKRWQKIIPLLVSVGGGALSVYVIKHIYLKARPVAEAVYMENGSSFPSGHATLVMAFYGFLFYTIYRAEWHPFKKFFIFLLPTVILTVGASRLYLGVHYLSDVLAGFVIGFAWILISLAVPKLKFWRFPDSRRL